MTVVVPQVTVVMPHYDMAAYLGEAVASVLGQDYHAFRLILADDATPDGAWRDAVRDMVDDPRMTVLQSSRNVGPFRLINACFAKISTEFICIQDADDISEPDRLAAQVAFLQAHPRVGIVGSAYRTIDADGVTLRRKRMPYFANLFDAMGKRFTILHGTMMFRRSILCELGGYDGTDRIAGDQDFFMRAALRFPIRNLPRALLRYRMHATSLTHDPQTGFESAARQAYAKALRQRRAMLRRMRPVDRALVAPGNDVVFDLHPVRFKEDAS